MGGSDNVRPMALMGSSFYKNAFLRLDKINNKGIKHHYMVKKKKKERELYCFHTEETVVLTADLLQQAAQRGAPSMWFSWGSNPGPSACEADL